MSQQVKKEAKADRIPITPTELERLLNERLLIVSPERIDTPPPDAVHELELYFPFTDAAGRLLIPLGSVGTFRVADPEQIESMQYSYGIPAGLLAPKEAAASQLQLPLEIPEGEEGGSVPEEPRAEGTDVEPLEDGEKVSRFYRFRAALLFAFTWSFKQMRPDDPDADKLLDVLVRSLEASALRQSPLMHQMLEELVASPQPPRIGPPKAKIEDTAVEVERWNWFGVFLKEHLFGGERMDDAARQWFFQFKRPPWQISQPDIPPAFEEERLVVLAGLLFLNLLGAATRDEERQIFMQDFVPVFDMLSREEQEQVYLYALLFKGLFMPEVNRYVISPSARDVMVFLECQALLLSGFDGLEGTKDQLTSLLEKAAEALKRAAHPEDLAAHVYAYYRMKNPAIANREVVWYHEGEVAEASDTGSAEAQTEELADDKSGEGGATKARHELSASLKEDGRVLLIRADDVVGFFNKHYPVVRMSELRQQGVLFLDEHMTDLQVLRAQNVFSLSRKWHLSGSMQIVLPGAKVYSTEGGIERLNELRLFHPEALASVKGLFGDARLVFIALEDFRLTAQDQAWLALFSRDAAQQVEVVFINLISARPKPGGRSASQKERNELVEQEIPLKQQLSQWFGDINLIHHDLQQANYELIRWLQPRLRNKHWSQTALWYLGTRSDVPEPLADALIRAQSDLIVYAPQMRYLFYNL